MQFGATKYSDDFGYYPGGRLQAEVVHSSAVFDARRTGGVVASSPAGRSCLCHAKGVWFVAEVSNVDF